MTFRRYSILFAWCICFCCLLMVISVVLLLATQEWDIAWFALCFAAFAALMPAMFPEQVTVDPKGIRCTQKGKVTWEYTWDQVIKLKRGNLYNWPSVSIVIDDHANEPIPYDYALHYFQLGRKAREALEKYSPKEISK